MKVPAKYWIPGVLITGIAFVEVFLRLALGLGNPPIVVADREMGYRFEANQKLKRFGNRLEYNQYSQRSDRVASPKPPGILRILMAGDSVLNGGNRKDQSEIISEELEARIARSGKPVEVLNASANSWGIGNQLGYLRKYGLFDSDAVILQIGTHDLVQETSKGDSISPNQKPMFALQEAIATYAWPRLQAKLRPRNSGSSSENANSNPNRKQQKGLKDRQFQDNMENLKAIAARTRENNIPLFVLYTSDRRDLLPTPNEPNYKSQFLQILKTLEIPAIDSHAAWSKLPAKTVETYFIDGVHLSVAGNRAIADLLFQQLCTEGKFSACKN